MTIWKNTCGGSWQGTIENGGEVSGKPGAFLFFIPKGALTHHLLKQAVPSRWSGTCALRGGLRLLREPLDKAAFLPNCQPCPRRRRRGFRFGSPCSWGGILPPHPAACLRQPATGSLTQIQGERIVPPLLVARRISRRTERKQGCPVSGHPFQKGQGDLWRFIIWRLR